MGEYKDCEYKLQGWDGYQCGFCGAEFKTRNELTQHQVYILDPRL